MRLCGWALALAHAKSGDAAMISGYLGKSDVFDDALVEFATAYAGQTRADHERFAAAAKEGGGGGGAGRVALPQTTQLSRTRNRSGPISSSSASTCALCSPSIGEARCVTGVAEKRSGLRRLGTSTPRLCGRLNASSRCGVCGSSNTPCMIADVVTGLYAEIGVLGALHHRRETGEGQHVDAAMLGGAERPPRARLPDNRPGAGAGGQHQPDRLALGDVRVRRRPPDCGGRQQRAVPGLGSVRIGSPPVAPSGWPQVLIARDWRFHASLSTGIPYGGKFTGKSEVEACFTTLAQNDDIQQFEPREFLEGPNHVTVLGWERVKPHPNRTASTASGSMCSR